MTALAEPPGFTSGRSMEVCELATVFKVLGDPARLRMLSMIACADGGEVCVCDLKAAFYLTDATVSHHLKLLREAGLILGRRQGSWIYYRVLRERLYELSDVLDRPLAS